MNWVDLVIIILILATIIRGWRAGLIQQVLVFVGFMSGLLIGSLLVTLIVPRFPNQLTKVFTLLLVELSLAFVLVVVARRISRRIKVRSLNLPLNGINNSFGSILGATFVLITIWLAASVLANIDSYGVGRNISRSGIIRSLDSALPPSPDVFARLEKIVSPNGLPDVFLGIEPQRTTVSPKNTVSNEMILKAKSSMVRIQGAGCGGIVSGSGFVVAKDTVVTAAHVLAGVKRLQVVDKKKSYWATAVAFDPELDMAVLKVKNLPGPPLTLSDKVLPDKSAAAIMGFAGGGPLAIENVTIIDNMTATGRSIYNIGQVDRNIYEILGNFESGDSGGPLLAPDGTVVGVFFGISLSQDSIGYALLIDQFKPLIDQAVYSNKSVSTGTCSAGLE